MRKAILITILLSWVLSPLSSLEPTPRLSHTPKATLEIRFTGIRNNKGLIAIGINRSEDGWPREPHLEYNWVKGALSDGVFVAKVTGLPYGTYAVSVLDDENSNLEMDMFMGIPKEGWGFSTNPPFKLSAPKFSECSLMIDQPEIKISIDLRYAGKGR